MKTTVMDTSVIKLLDKKDYEGLSHCLSQNPGLANEGIPYDNVNATKAHPLHRVCDRVFSKEYTDEEASKIAKIFLEHGANVDGNTLTIKQDTPLIAAASLHADDVAILYIENGADIKHAGCHGGTALHWASWCGRPKVVKRLIEGGGEIDKKCIDFKATPLFWAVHGLKKEDKNNRHGHLECIKILINSGADKSIPNIEGESVVDLLENEDVELKELLA